MCESQPKFNLKLVFWCSWASKIALGQMMSLGEKMMEAERKAGKWQVEGRQLAEMCLACGSRVQRRERLEGSCLNFNFGLLKIWPNINPIVSRTTCCARNLITQE